MEKVEFIVDVSFEPNIEAMRQAGITELVRCKDCKHWDKDHTEECDNTDSVCFHNGWCKPDWFCANGERR